MEGPKVNYVIPVSNGILEHREKIGPAIWLFLLLIDWVTAEQDGIGLVLGGKPVKVEKIMEVLRLGNRQVRKQIQRLESHGYIRLRRNPYGFSISVTKSKKRDRYKSASLDWNKGASLNGQSGTKVPGRVALKCRNKEDNTVDISLRERRQKAPSPKNPDSRVKEFLSWYPTEYRKRFGSPYHVEWGKDGKRVKDLLRDFVLSEIQNRALQFLNSEDPWVRQNGGFTIAVFASQINKLISTARATDNRPQRKEMPL